MQNGVGASSKSDFGRYLGGIDDIKLYVLLADYALDIVRNAFEGFLLIPKRVEEQAASLLYALENIVFLKI